MSIEQERTDDAVEATGSPPGLTDTNVNNKDEPAEETEKLDKSKDSKDSKADKADRKKKKPGVGGFSSFPETGTPNDLPSFGEDDEIQNLKSFDPFAEADEEAGDGKSSVHYIHIRIQQRNGRKTLTTIQGLPEKFDQRKILKVIKKKFACNGTTVHDSAVGQVIQLQGDQRKDVHDFLIDKVEGLEMDPRNIKVHGF